LLNKNPLKLSEFLRNKYFVKGKSQKMSKLLKKTFFSNENVLNLPEFLKNKNVVKGKSPSFARILEK
jgi:hypothetical protein